jgi:hypothetical protein
VLFSSPLLSRFNSSAALFASVRASSDIGDLVDILSMEKLASDRRYFQQRSVFAQRLT